MKMNAKQVMEQADLYVKNDMIIKNKNGAEGIKYLPYDLMDNTVAIIEKGDIAEIYYNGERILWNLYL